MGELTSYVLRLILAAVIGVAASLLLGATLFLLVGAIETSRGAAAPDFFVAIIGLGAFATALVVTRFM